MNNGIAQANGKAVLLKAGGNTDDIVEAVLDTVPEVREQTREFSRRFTPDKDGMRELWYWVKTNIRYKEDPLGVQWIREPARLWYDMEGDCKSFTVFIVSVLENLGVKYFIRFSNTDDSRTTKVNHVYPVAIIGGREIIVDAVYTGFNKEHSFYNAVDYTMTEIYRLSGIGSAAPQPAVVIDELDQYANNITELLSDIPDHVTDQEGDITEMTDGEFARFQSAQLLEVRAATTDSSANAVMLNSAAQALRQGSIAGIGNLDAGTRATINTYLAQSATLTDRAFKAPLLEIPDAVSGHPRIAGILDKIKEGWKKLMNWLFKGGFAAASPMSLYLFLKKKKIGAKTDKKIAKAEEVMQYNMDTGQFKDPYTIMQAYRIGIIKNMGKQPEELLNDAAAGKATIAGNGISGWVAVIGKVIGFVIDIIKKIAGLFKKKKAPEVSVADAPDDVELANEVKAGITDGGKTTGGSSSAAPSGGGNANYMPLVIGGVALAGLYIFSKK